MDEHDSGDDGRTEPDRSGPPDPGRREILSWSWKILGAGLAVEAGWTTYDILNPRPSGAFGGVVEAGTVAEYPEMTVRYFLNGRFYMVSYQGSLFALYQKCPHLGCRVPFCDSSKQFECPCHGSVFNVIGEYSEGPSPRGMDRFAVSIEGDQVMVDTGALEEGPARGVRNGPAEPAGPSCLDEGAGAPPAGGMDEQMGEATGPTGANP